MNGNHRSSGNGFIPMRTLLSILVVLTVVQLQCTHASQPYHQYEITLRPERLTDEIAVQCLLDEAIAGDHLLIYENNGANNLSALIRRFQLGPDAKSRDVTLHVNRWSEHSQYLCELRRSGTESPVSHVDVRVRKNQGYRYLVYDPEQITNVRVKLGHSLVLQCPINSQIAASEGETVVWFQQSGYRILHVATDGTLRFDKISPKDLGTYFCAIHSTDQEKRVHLPVRKIQLTAEGHTLHVQKVEPNQNRDSCDVYYCPGVPEGLSQVSWEAPLGTVLVGYNQQTLRRCRTTNDRVSPSYYCTYSTFEDFTVGDEPVSEFDRPLVRTRRSVHVGPTILVMPRRDPENGTVLMKCNWKGEKPEGQTLRFRWIDPSDGKITEGNEIYQNLQMYGAMSEAEAEHNSIKCEVTTAESDEVIGTTTMSLAPIAVRTIGSVDLAQIPKLVYGFSPGESVEMVCRVEREFVETGKDIEWSFNGGQIPGGLQRIDRLKASILLTNDLKPEHEGHYVCHLGSKSLQVQLIQRPVVVGLGTEPESDTRWANAGESTEFHCRLTGRDNGNQLIDWSFIPSGSEEEVLVHPDVVIERPAATPATSFISIHNVQKYHEGIYVCRALDMKAVAQLTVLTRTLSVNPTQLDARPGTTVRFLCELSAVSGVSGGKLYWMRTDRKDLRPGKEEVIGSTGGRTLLIVHSVDWSDHNTTYMCTDGVSSAESRIFVREACAPGYRSCASGGCVDSGAFCDGKPDCDDGSDEDPTKCNECAPNELRCETVDDKKPLRNCFLQYWKCDGEDDCGNNFDETYCPAPSKPDLCNGTQYICPDSNKPIARAFLCDGVPDCEPNGEDERECSLPSVIQPSGEMQLVGKRSGNLTMTCVVYGKPPPAVSWRYNWGHLREGVKHVVNTTVIDCNTVISHLTLIDLEPEAGGLYTCEAVNKGRTLAPDFSVNVAQGGLCNPPMFNDAAWFEDMCLKCYCSGVTDQCQSAQGYVKSSTDKVWEISEQSSIIRTYQDTGMEESRDGLEFAPRLIRYKSQANGFAFLEGPFGLNGSWLNSYGTNLKFMVRLFGSSTEHQKGAMVALHGPKESLYWCLPTDRVLFYAMPVGYENDITVRLNERERWFSDMNCTQPLSEATGRNQFMNLLKNVNRLGIRANIYDGQTSFELQDLRLEHVIKSDLPNVWVAEIEQCECPPGYIGLSCEKCAYGYEEDPVEPGKCRLRCACDQCDEDGNCLDCPGNRSGPRCQQCKAGYYRPIDSSLADDCLPCDKCAQDAPHVVKECVDSLLPDEDPYCKCTVKEDGKLVDPDCDRCVIAEKQGLPVPPECETRPEPSQCNAVGTKSGTVAGECECEPGYEGDTCDTCSEGYFRHQKRCLGCFCAGQTTSCRLSDQHYFWNITLSDPQGIDFDLWLAQASAHGSMLRSDYTADGNPRLERVNGDVIVRHPILERGLLHIAFNLRQREDDSTTSSNLPIYRSLYGGRMSFRLNSPSLDPNLVTQAQAGVVIELESPRFGRVWTQASYNVETQRYEVEFHENWWPGGWRIGSSDAFGELGPQQGLTRGQLLRVLGTTSSISILTSSGPSEGLKDTQLSGLSIQVARLGQPRLSTEDDMMKMIAPVEVCDCPEPSQPDERPLSLSCEGCRDPKRATIVRLQPGGSDLECEDCIGPNCADCANGLFKYNVYNGQSFDTCQTGLAMDSEQRRVLVRVGSPLSLVCRATSYHGGILSHQWITPSPPDPNRMEISRRGLSKPTQPMSKRDQQPFNQSIHRSEAVLFINSAQKSDSGLYHCEAIGLGSALTQPTYVEVLDEADSLPLPHPDEEKMGSQNVIRVPMSPSTPFFTEYTMEAEPKDAELTVIRARVAKPSDLNTYQLVWFASNGSVIQPKPTVYDSQTGEVVLHVNVPYSSVASGQEPINGYFVGNSPILNPYWTPMREPKLVDPSADEVTAEDVIPPEPEVRIPFMQPRTIKVRVTPGKTPIRVTWQRIGRLPEDISSTEPVTSTLPEGVTQNRTDLTIWAGTEQHEGVYEAVVIRESDGAELKRFNVTVRVDPMIPDETVVLPPGKAEDLPDPVKDANVTVTPKPGTVWDFVVQGFTPDAEYCEHPTWAMIDYQTNTITDVTERVHRLSPSNFRVEYPLTSGIYLRFQCQPVPRTNVTGEIKFNITSPDPRIVFQTVYDDTNSTFPTRLICLDLNPNRPSYVNISSDTMTADRIKDALSIVTADKVRTPGDVPIRKVELDWRRIGDFDPFNDAGRFTCFVNNSETSGSKTLVIPSDEVPVIIPQDPYTRVYIYSPDVHIGPEDNGLHSITVNEGQRLRVYCNYDSRPLGDFHGWRTDSDPVRQVMHLEQRGYSALASTDSVTKEMDGEILECSFGERAKRVKFNVISEGETRINVRVLTDDLVDERIIATAGSDLNLTCAVEHVEGKPINIDRIDWFMQYSSGRRKKATDSKFADKIVISDNGRHIYFNQITRKPSGAKIFCVVRPVDTATAMDAYHPSPMVEFWVREPKWSTSIEPTHRPGVVQSVEAQTLHLKCVVTDLWRNKPAKSSQITWETRVLPVSGVEQTRIPSSYEIPWLGTRQDNELLVVGGIRLREEWVGEFRCNARDPLSNTSALSDWVKLEVLAGDTLSRMPKIRLEAKPNAEFPYYPTRVECIDDNEEFPSEVTWTRQEASIPSENVQLKPNSALLTWTHDGVEKFLPQSDAGVYVCRATNAYSSSVKQFYLPMDMMPADPIPISKHKMEITSDVNQIFQENGEQYTRVIQGNPFELLCTYYGHPAPVGGLQWSVERINDLGQSIGTASIAMLGLRVQSGRRYWSEIGAPKFDALGKHAGVYRCEALAQDGRVIKRSLIRVELHKVKVKIEELSDSGLIEGTEGDSGIITCNAYDGYFNFILPEARYSWELEKMNGDRIHPSMLASEVTIDGNVIRYTDLSPVANGFRARCIAHNDTARYVSPDFGFRIRRTSKEPISKPDTEPGVPRQVLGDGREGVLLVIHGVNNATGHVSMTSGEDANLTCIAVDPVTSKSLPGGEFQFGWRLTGLQGESVSPALLASGPISSSMNEERNAGILLLKDVKPSHLAPRPSAQIQCLATRLADGVTYYSSPIDFVVYPSGMEPDPEAERKERAERDAIRVKVDGLDERGMLSGTQGAIRTLKCIATESKTNFPVKENAEIAWEFTGLDGTPIDTGALLEPESGSIEITDNEITMTGLRQTSSVRGRCRVRKLREEDYDEEEKADPGEVKYDRVFYSPYFRFDVTDGGEADTRDFSSPINPDIGEKLWDVEVDVTGLDENGHLTGLPGQDAEVTCKVTNTTTEEMITSDSADYRVHYGWEFQRINGQAATTQDIATGVKIDSKSNTLKLTNLRAQSQTNRTQARCVVELIKKSMDGHPVTKGIRMASKYFVVNVPPSDELVVEDMDPDRTRYELSVRGLNDHGVLPLREGQSIKLECVVRDIVTDTLVDMSSPQQVIGWQLPVYPSGFIGNLADMAREVTVTEKEFHMNGIRSDLIDGLRGRCWYYDGAMYYHSRYFPIVVPRSSNDGRVRVEVQEVGTNYDRQYTCAAYNTKTGSRLTDVAYEWKFTASNDQEIHPAYFFESIETSGNQLAVSQRQNALRLPEHLRDKLPIEGRCLVLYQPYAGDLSGTQKINIYESRPFMLLHPTAQDPNEVITQPDPLREGKRVTVYVEGVDRDLVTVPEGGTVTLTCRATDVKTSQPIEGLSYTWEIQQRDGSSVDTGSLASTATLVQGPGGHQLTLVGIRPRAAGLRARCVVMNKSEQETVEVGPLKPGEQVASNFFDFDVTRTVEPGTSGAEPDYRGYKDFKIDEDETRYKVVIGGLDENGHLKAKEGSNVTLEIKTLDTVTGELASINSDPTIKHFGLETRYDNGQSAPFSNLADSVTIHGEDGVINLNGLRDETSPPTQFRIVVEREVNLPEPDPETGSETKQIRIASDFVDVISLGEGEEDKPVKPQEPIVEIHPTIDGLNRCGHLPISLGENATLTCRPNDTRIGLENLIYGWELRHPLGQTLPHVNLLAKAVRQEGNKLHLYQMMDPGLSLIGRCVIIQTTGKCLRFSSAYFTIGPPGPGCGPDDSVIVPEIPGEKHPPTISYNVRISIEGLDENRQVVATPGDNVTLKCTALNDTTGEPIPHSAIGWGFVSDTGEPLNAGQLATRFEQTKDNELRLSGLYSNPNARGRCVVSLEQRVTLSSPYFIFNVREEGYKPSDTVNPSYSDKRVRVEISGLNDRGQISVNRVGDDASLRCQAVVVASSKPLLPGQGTRYGWEWRYMDEDPVSTTNVAVAVEANGERLGLRGIRAPPGSRGRNVKGRCVVHVPASQVDPSLSESAYLVYGSEYFTVDVVKKPTTLDPDVIPIPGRPSDGIKVIVTGLDESGNLAGVEDDSVAVNCETRNATTNEKLSTEGIRAEYNVFYGWEFADVTGRSIDSSLFADSITTDSNGYLRLRGLAGPKRGNLPFKIRCVAVVDRRPTTPDESTGPAKYYNSDYFALEVTRKDGSSTADKLPGDVTPDITGDKVRVRVEGLRPDGTMTAQPGEDAQLTCIAEDSETGMRIDDATFGWELRKQTGGMLNLALLANKVVQDGPVMQLSQLKPIGATEDQSSGRCVVHTRGQSYRSPYFRIKVASVPKGDEVLGDGRITVTVKGIDGKRNEVRMAPDDTMNLTCVARDAETGETLSDVIYGWDVRYRPTADGPYIDGSLGPLVKQISEIENGVLTIDAVQDPPSEGMGKIRCRVLNGTETYSSPFYRFVVSPEDAPLLPPEPSLYPKYRVRVTGLDDAGHLSAQPGDDVQLTCTAYDAKTGALVEDVKFQWELKRTDNEAVSSSEVVTGFLSAAGGTLHLEGLKRNPGTVKGRCLAVDDEGWDASPYFIFNVISEDEPAIAKPEIPKGIGEDRAEPNDDRVTVKVEGLDENGNFVGQTGSDSELQCDATVKDGIEGHILSRGWEFLDGHGNPIPVTALADNIKISEKDGTLQLGSMRSSNQATITNGIKGRCIVRAELKGNVTSPDGITRQTVEQILFTSDNFGVSINEEGTAEETPGGKDVKGMQTTVTIEGLNQPQALLAETGDSVRLTCVAKDSETGEPVETVTYSWEVRDRSGNTVPTDELAQRVYRQDDSITFVHLKPTDRLSAEDQRMGRCVVYNRETEHKYQSAYFYMDIRRPAPGGVIDPTSPIEVSVKGIPDNGVLTANEGDNVELECEARDKSTGELLPKNEAIYHFQFTEAAPDSEDVYGGHIANEVKQETLPDGASKLTLSGIKADTWYQGRCIVLHIPGGQTIEGEVSNVTEPPRRYVSKYFWSGVTKPDAKPTEPDDVKNQTVVIGKFTHDPQVIVKADGVGANDLISAAPGNDVELHCYAIDVPTGKPIVGLEYAWELRAADDTPLDSHLLSTHIETGSMLAEDGSKFRVVEYRSTGDGVKIRCVATGSQTAPERKHRGAVYASSFYTFETSKEMDVVDELAKEAKRLYDPDKLQLEVNGLNSDGTLSKKEGEDVTLQCKVIDKTTGQPIEDDEFDIGWSVGTGPDARPIPLDRLAQTVIFNRDELVLHGLERTAPGTGGLRSHCIVRLGSEQLERPDEYAKKPVVLTSDAFVIHVDRPDDVVEDDKPDETKDTPYINWIPGKKPKDAVIVKVHSLDEMNTVRVEPGANLDLSCMALDAVSLRRIMPNDNIAPIFSWELRNHPGGHLLDYNQLSNGEIIITQPSEEDTGEEAGVSELKMTMVRRPGPMGRMISGRCTVRLGEQIFRSPYFHILLESNREMEDYQISPKGYWTDDGAVQVIVNGLNADGNKKATEGSDVQLQCEALDAKSKQPLSDDVTTYGWQLIDPINDELKTPLAESGTLAGAQLQLSQIHLPNYEKKQYTLWGWCVVDVRSPDATKDAPVKHYRSKPFRMSVLPKDTDITELPSELRVRDDIFVKVDGITDDGTLTAMEGETKHIQCRAIDALTGHVVESSDLTYSWDWRTLDGGFAHVGLIGEEVKARGEEFTVSNVRSGVPIKGRCLVIKRPSSDTDTIDEQSIPITYYSDFFFFDVEPLDPESKKVEKECRPVDATDEKFSVIVDQAVYDEITLNANEDVEITATVKDSLGNAVEPKGYSFELSYLSGQVAHAGEIAESFTFEQQTGKLSLTNVQYPTKPIKVRFAALISAPDQEDLESTTSSCSPLLYRSDYASLIVQASGDTPRPKWTDLETPVYDVNQKAYSVKINGLDDQGDALGTPDEPLELDCAVYDKYDMEAEFPPNAYTWQLIDAEDHPANPGRLADQVEIVGGKKLKLTNFHASAEQDGIRGRCVITISVPTPVDADINPELPPAQQYASAYFDFRSKKKESIVVPDETGETGREDDMEDTVTTATPEEEIIGTTPSESKPDEEQTDEQDFKLQLDSPTNEIYEIGDNQQTILARVQRPFELNCRAVFKEGTAGTRSDTGEALPRLVWYYRQPEIPGDVPIPSQLFPVSPPRMETLNIGAQTDYKISIEADAYSFRDDKAEFHCNAYMESNDEPVVSKVIYIQKAKEQFSVRIFDEDSRSRAYAFVGTTKTLTCYVDDVDTGERIEPHGYQWEVSTGDGTGEWMRVSGPKQPAESVDGWTSNQLRLENLKLPEASGSTETTYEFRCIAAYNNTFDTTSGPFVLNVRNKPKIEYIRLDREKPTEAVLDTIEIPEDSYDATQDYQLGCKPEVTGSEAVAVWQKCEDDECTVAKDFVPKGDKLFLFGNSTRYTDEGMFRCQVSLQLKEYNYKLTESKRVRIKRKSAPAIYSGDSITYTINDEMSLQCTDESSSPESTVDWTFEPSGTAPEERKNPIVLGKKYAYGRIYIFAIARGQLMPEHSGNYTCTAKNSYGTASSTIEVTITEELTRQSRRVYRERHRRLIPRRRLLKSK